MGSGVMWIWIVPMAQTTTWQVNLGLLFLFLLLLGFWLGWGAYEQWRTAHTAPVPPPVATLANSYDGPYH